MATDALSGLVEEDTRDTRKMDPELLALQRIGRMLEEMEEYPRVRVLAYLMARHAPGMLVSAFGKSTVPIPAPAE